MLLLVLILVVIAFGLLVVALLSGSVLWAWVSVGVSVVAAVVLLVDWLQRRAAVKAGAAPAVEPAAGAPAPLPSPPMGFQPGMGRPPMADMDPATEVLPVVPSSSRGGEETVVAQAPKQVEPRPSDAQQTVVMPAVQPSGSPARPSGADPSVTSSSANSSPTVTGDDADRSVPGFGTGDATASSGAATGIAAGAAAAALAAGVSGRKADDAPVEKSPSLQKAPSAEKGSVQAAAPSEADAVEKVGTAASAASDPASGDPSSSASVPAGTDAAVPPAGSDSESTVKVEAHTKAPAEPTMPTSSGATTAGAPEAVDLFGAAPVRQPVEQAPAEPESAAAEQAPLGEAPEEVRDPVAAELVGKLDDEVVVVDEQPRYHVTECRALVSVAVIPLPVREAVELGFTPCGWCSPDRTLAGRHQTASR